MHCNESARLLKSLRRWCEKHPPTCTTPEKLWLHPWAAESGTMATDMTTLSALHSAIAIATMATTFALSDVRADNNPDSTTSKPAPEVATLHCELCLLCSIAAVSWRIRLVEKGKGGGKEERFAWARRERDKVDVEETMEVFRLQIGWSDGRNIWLESWPKKEEGAELPPKFCEELEVDKLFAVMYPSENETEDFWEILEVMLLVIREVKGLRKVREDESMAWSMMDDVVMVLNVRFLGYSERSLSSSLYRLFNFYLFRKHLTTVGLLRCGVEDLLLNMINPGCGRTQNPRCRQVLLWLVQSEVGEWSC